MSEYLIQGDTLTGIADAIREKVGSSDGIDPAQMAELVKGIETGGGGGTVMFASGTFVVAEDTKSHTVLHGLGTRPDVVVYWSQAATTQAFTSIFGANAVKGVLDLTVPSSPANESNSYAPPVSAAQYTTNEIGSYFWGSETTTATQKVYLDGKGSDGVTPYCAPYSADSESFVIGVNSASTNYHLRNGLTYRWLAVAGVSA